MQTPPEPEISNYRGPGQRALDLVAGAFVSAVASLLVLIFVGGFLMNPFLWPGPRRSEDAKLKATETQLNAFGTALLAYTKENGQPPTTAQGLDALRERPNSSPKPARWRVYLDIPEVPKDPWGDEYQYASPGPSGELWVIRSYGKDGAPGGKGHAADLVLTHLDAVRDEQSRR